MKRINLFILVIFALSVSSFVNVPPKIAPKKSKALYIIYVDNSRDKTKVTSEHLSQAQYDLIAKRVEDISHIPNAVIAFFLSNEKSLFVTDFGKAKGVVQSMDYTSIPNLERDNIELTNKIIGQEYVDVNSLNIDFYLNEYILSKDLVSKSAGFLISAFPKKIQYLLNVDDRNTKVNLYYPADSKSITESSVNSFFNYSQGFDDSKSKVQTAIIPL